MFLRPFLSAVFIVGLAAASTVAQGPPAGPPAAANDTVKGAALLADARTALGGQDKLAAIKRVEIKGEMTQIQGNQTLDGDITLQIELPDKMKIEEEISLPGGAITITRLQGLNGSEVWDATEGGLPGGFGRGGRGGGFRGGGGRLGGVLGGVANDPNAQARELTPEQQEQLRQRQLQQRQTDLARYLVAFLATTSEAPAWIGTAVTPKDEKADVLEFKTADGTATRLFLDETTHLPLMMTYAGPAGRAGGQGRQGGGRQGEGRQGGGRQGRGAAGGDAAAGAPDAQAQAGRRGGGVQAQPVTVQMYLGDYKVVNGIRMPHHITREINGEIQEELTLKNFKFNPNFKANTFTQPKQ